MSTIKKLTGNVTEEKSGYIFVHADNKSGDWLNSKKEKWKIYEKSPFDGQVFFFKCPSSLHSLVGKNITAWCRVKKYVFESKYEHNKGEKIMGWSLYSTKIKINRIV